MGINEEVYNKKLGEFRRLYKPGSYPVFVKYFVPDRLFKSSLNYSIGSGAVAFTGDLSNNFKGNATTCAWMYMDRIYNWL